MSASTVSITANPTTSRRRPVVTTDMKSGLDLLGTDASPVSGGVKMGTPRDSSQSIERSRREAVVQVKKSIAPNSGTTSKPYQSHRKSISKPKWQTVISVFTKNLVLLLLLAGLVQMVKKVYFNSVVGEDVVGIGNVGFSDNVDGKIAEVEAFVKRSAKMMQVAEVEEYIQSDSRMSQEEMEELDKKIEEREKIVDLEVKDGLIVCETNTERDIDSVLDETEMFMVDGTELKPKQFTGDDLDGDVLEEIDGEFRDVSVGS